MTANYDYERPQRLGMPEAVLCETKDTGSLEQLIRELHIKSRVPFLLTRLYRQQFADLAPELASLLDYDELSGTAFLHGVQPKRPGKVAIVCAGTSDMRVAQEAARTLTFLGIEHAFFCDIGVAGLHRLLGHIDEICHYDVTIAVAGMDAALASVLGGLYRHAVIGVPTSVGYGVAAGGQTALNAMLASCAQGVLVTNIDNGFGAACGAFRILSAIYSKTQGTER